MSSRRILAYGEDSLVIATRAMILQREGYEVAYTTHAGELLSLLHGIFFDALILGDSLRTRENVRLVEKVRDQFPAIPILTIQDDKDERDPWSTAFVHSNPEDMLSAVRALFKPTRKAVQVDSLARMKVMHQSAGK